MTKTAQEKIDELVKVYEARIAKLTQNLKTVEKQRDEALALAKGFKKQVEILKHGLNNLAPHFRKQAE
jgi:hypothetical protein